MIGLLLPRNRGLAAKDILLDLTGGCFRQLGHKLDSLGTLEVRQTITTVIARLGFCCGHPASKTTNAWGRLAPAGLLAFARGSQSAVEEFGGGAVGADPIVPAGQLV